MVTDGAVKYPLPAEVMVTAVTFPVVVSTVAIAWAVTAGWRVFCATTTLGFAVQYTLSAVPMTTVPEEYCGNVNALIAPGVAERVAPISDVVHVGPVYVVLPTWMVVDVPVHLAALAPVLKLTSERHVAEVAAKLTLGAATYGPLLALNDTLLRRPTEFTVIVGVTTATGAGAAMVTCGVEVYPEPPQVAQTVALATVPKADPVPNAVVAVATVALEVVAITPYWTQVPEPGVPTTPPAMPPGAQNFPRLAAELSTPTWLKMFDATVESKLNLAPH